jgi:small membrane protein
MILQAIMVVFCLFAVSRSYLRYRDGLITFPGCLFWSSLWVVATVAVFIKNWTSVIAALLGIGRGVDMLLFAAVLLLSYLSFRLYVHLEVTRRALTKLVRSIAINDKLGLLLSKSADAHTQSSDQG